MATKPTVLPKWAEDDQVDPVSGESNVYEPPENRKLSGWNRREIPPRQWLNWLARYYYRWILWAKEEIERLLSSAFAGRGLKMEGTPSTINTYRRLTQLTGPDTLLTSNFDGVFWYSSASESHTISIGGQAVDEGGTETVIICREDSSFNVILEALGTTVVWSFNELVSADGYNIKPGEVVRLVKVGTNSYVAYADNGISETVDLGGSFDPGEEAIFVRKGDIVTVYCNLSLSHSSSSTPSSALGSVPQLFRPTTNKSNVYSIDISSIRMVSVIAGANQISLSYRAYDGTAFSDTDTGSAFAITYGVN